MSTTPAAAAATPVAEDYKELAKNSQCAFCLNSLATRPEIFEIKTGRKAPSDNVANRGGEAIGFVCNDCVKYNEAKFTLSKQGVPVQLDALEPL